MWTLKAGINTPKGMYNAKGDDLAEEIKNAARFAGLEAFNVKVDGKYVDTPADLKATNFDGVKTVSIEPYDTAGI
jgi:hypothetical protein